MQPLNSEAETVCLESGIANLGTVPTTIEMCVGIGWIAYNDQDIVMYPGQKMSLGAAKHPILISSPIKNQRIVFKVKPNSQQVKDEGKQNKPSSLLAAILNIIKG